MLIVKLAWSKYSSIICIAEHAIIMGTQKAFVECLTYYGFWKRKKLPSICEHTIRVLTVFVQFIWTKYQASWKWHQYWWSNLTQDATGERLKCKLDSTPFCESHETEYGWWHFVVDSVPLWTSIVKMNDHEIGTVALRTGFEILQCSIMLTWDWYGSWIDPFIKWVSLVDLFLIKAVPNPQNLGCVRGSGQNYQSYT